MKNLSFFDTRLAILRLAVLGAFAGLLLGPFAGFSSRNVRAQKTSSASQTDRFPIPASVELLSLNQAHTAAGNSFSTTPVISANGRYVAFMSSASDLVPNDLNGGFRDVFRLDLQTRLIELVSFNSAGTGGGNAGSEHPLISADGRFVAFESSASDIVPNGTFGGVFVRDMQMGVTKAASIRLNGASASGRLGAISPDARYVAFVTGETNLTNLPEVGSGLDVFVRDMTLNETKMVSVNQAGTTSGNSDSGLYHNALAQVVISPDGRYVGFLSNANDLVSNDLPGAIPDLFIRDLMLGTTRLINVDYETAVSAEGDPGNPVMSADGRYIAYQNFSGRLAPNDANSDFDIFLYDVQSQVNSLVSIRNGGGASANGRSVFPAITPDGRFVAFSSTATNLTSTTDTNLFEDVFVRDRNTGINTLVSAGRGTNIGGNNVSDGPSISNDGRFVAFYSFATNLTLGVDKNRSRDAFLRDVTGGETACVSSSRPPNGTPRGAADFVTVAQDGTFAIFTNDSGDFSLIDQNSTLDLFFYRNTFDGIINRSR